MFSTQTSVEKFQKNSSKLLDVFTKTVNGLTDVNNDIDAEIQSREEQIKTLQDEHQNLHGIKDSNNKIIEKLGKIFE
jgi:hypothetical protein